MQKLLDELPQLLVTVVLLILVTILLVFGIIPRDDSLVSTVFTAALSYWLLNGAFKFGVSSGSGSGDPSKKGPS